MINVTIQAVLALPVVQTASLIAGKSGLSNIVHSVTVHDNIPTQSDLEIATFDGDIYITSLFFGKDNPQFIIDFMKYMKSLNASAVFVIDEFIDRLPVEAEEFCNKNSLPVVMMDRRTPYSLIISSIMEYKLVVQQMKSIENNLKALTSFHTSLSEKETIIRDLNPNFSNFVQIFYCRESETGDHGETKLIQYAGFISSMRSYPSCFSAEYRNGLLVVISRKNKNKVGFERIADEIIQNIRKIMSDSIIGVSDILNLSELGTGISQSFMAACSENFDENNFAYYSELGISKLLIAAEGNPELEKFYQETILPIKKYDEKNGTELLSTIFMLAKHDMDFRQTSDALFLHENTVRYRVNKAKELMPYGKSDMDFYLTLSAAYRIHLLLYTE